jgi:DNA repair photolyase
VHVTITTLDRDIARKLEPRAPSPEQRLTAIRKLADAGVPVGVFVGPVFPGLTDDPDQLAALAAATADAGGSFLVGLPLRIGANFADPFLEAILRDFPAIAARYRAQARDGGMDRRQVASISAVFDELRFRFGLDARPPHRAPSDSRPRQLALPV